ncbi:MAG: MFS transporter [Nitrospiraceae bacterium]|nr:MFS transporter [Nitrospiraceae bacterium]
MTARVSPGDAGRTGFKVLGAISFSHFLNDTMQSLLLAIYPLLKGKFQLSFAQIGLITLCYQLTASLLQPAVGLYTDHHPRPYSLVFGMGCTLAGLLFLGTAGSYGMLLFAAALVGTGSAVFHPESSRVARMASGGRHGLAQSIFQVGGNTGTAMGPLLAAWIVIPRGQGSVAWFSLAAFLAIAVLWQVGGWYRRNHRIAARVDARRGLRPDLPTRKVALSVLILLVLVFSKYFYLASLSSYYIFYLMHRFHLSVRSAQVHLFAFLFAVAVGTFFGGPIGDRIGRKRVIWVSILGAAPFALALPYADLAWTGILAFMTGLILASAFSAILVFAQELIPGKVGAISGLFFGFAFGMGGIGAAVLGKLADQRGIVFVYHLCSYLPLLGVLAMFLPDAGIKGRSGRHFSPEDIDPGASL